MMEQNSLLSRFVEPVVGFLKTVPLTIREGLSELADAVSPARKRRRNSDSSSYQPLQPHVSPLHRHSPEKSSHPQTKRLRLSDASASNAAGSSVPTPAAFRPAQDLLAGTTSPLLPNPQSEVREMYPNQCHLSLSPSMNENLYTSLDSTRRFSIPVRGLKSDLDVQTFFRYPSPRRRPSLIGLRDIWPSEGRSSGSRRHHFIARNKELNAAQLYMQQVEERHNAQPSITYPSQRRTSTALSAVNFHTSPAWQAAPQLHLIERDPLPQQRSSHLDIHTRDSFSRTAKLAPMRVKKQLRGMKKKRFYNEQRAQRSRQTSIKKFAAAAASRHNPTNVHTVSKRWNQLSEAGRISAGSNVPMPFVELMEKDALLGQKLLKMHGATLTRLTKSQNRSRHRQLECWLAEQDLKQIQQKREETRRLNAIESEAWKHTEDSPQHPPNDEEFVNAEFWNEENSEWEEELDEEATAERGKQITVCEENSAFAPLSESALRRLRATINDDSNYFEELAKIHGCVIRGEDLRRLKPNCWLNDEIVNAYMALLTSRTERLRLTQAKLSPSSASLVPNVKIMNSFFYTKLVQFNKGLGRSEYNYSRVRRWTRRFDIFSFDLMLIPINEQNVHWTLGIIDFKNCIVEHLDSMGTGGSRSVRELLMRWVQDEAEDKDKSLDPSKWKAIERRVPIQENTDDCGVFLCKFADFICRGWKKFTFSQRHMNYFRARIAHELLMGKA